MRMAYDDEDNVPMSDDAFDRIDQDGHNPTVYGSFSEMKAMESDPVPMTSNCHERCRFSKFCYRTFGDKGSNRADFPDECALYYKLDDLMEEAKDIPFFDPDDIPEEEEGFEDESDS